MERSCRSPSTHYSKVKAKVESLEYVGQTSKLQGQICWYPWEGLVSRNTHVKYQSPNTYHSKDTAKLKIFRKSNMKVKVKPVGTH
jgi:hypothetical protein